MSTHIDRQREAGAGRRAQRGARRWLAFVVATVASLAGAGAARAQLTPDQQLQLLDHHNQLRSEVALGQLAGQPAAANMARLVWDPNIAQTAQNWANQCNFSHNPNRGFTGENLFLGPSTPLNEGVDLWFGENTSYTFGPFSNDNLGTAGHYTQVVWAATTSIGCGAAVCPSLGGAFFLVCDYAPPGNFIGQTPYMTGTSCTQCPAGLGRCTQGLCTVPVSEVPAVPARTLVIIALLLLAAGIAVPRVRRAARANRRWRAAN
jgi:hypothetical protein